MTVGDGRETKNEDQPWEGRRGREAFQPLYYLHKGILSKTRQ